MVCNSIAPAEGALFLDLILSQCWRNSGEAFAIHAASRINQLRKSSSAASQLLKYLLVNNFRDQPNRSIELPQRKSM